MGTALPVLLVSVFLFACHVLHSVICVRQEVFGAYVKFNYFPASGDTPAYLISSPGIGTYPELSVKCQYVLVPNFFGSADLTEPWIKGGGGIAAIGLVWCNHRGTEGISPDLIEKAALYVMEANPGPAAVFARGMSKPGFHWGIEFADNALPKILGMAAIYLLAATSLVFFSRFTFRQLISRYQSRRRAHRLSLGLCPNCAYATSANTICPECGQPVRP